MRSTLLSWNANKISPFVKFLKSRIWRFSKLFFEKLYLSLLATILGPKTKTVSSLQDPDDDDDEELCTCIVSLMQKGRRAMRDEGLDTLTIGFAIYHLKDPEATAVPLDMEHIRYNRSVARSKVFVNLREVSRRFRLPPGTYVIIPSTFNPDEAGDFLLRVFTEKSNNAHAAQ